MTRLNFRVEPTSENKGYKITPDIFMKKKLNMLPTQAIFKEFFRVEYKNVHSVHKSKFRLCTKLQAYTNVGLH